MTVGLLCAMALTVSAAEAKKHQKLTPEQKAAKKELIAKYDTNKDGKLDKAERAKMTKEDKEKLAELSGHKKDAKGESKET